MSKSISAAVIAVMGICIGSSNAIAAPNLYKNYAYDSPIGKYSKSAGFYDCSNAEQKGRCKDNIGFVGEKFTLALSFTGDHLRTVGLIAPYKGDLYPKVSDALAKSFTIVSMENESEYMDLVKLANTAIGETDYVARFTAFENKALGSGDLTYTFVEVPKSIGYADATELLKAAPEDVRSAAVRVFIDDGEANLVVRFELPNLNLNHNTSSSEEAF